MKILLLEDDKLFNETLQEFLEEEGFIVDSVLDPYSAYDLAYKNSYDLYIFDINLPFENGIDTLKSLADSGDKTATIFITSRDDKETLVDAFSAGADDYLKKPIDLDELLLRVYAVTKREKRENIIEIGRYTLDREREELFLDSKALGLTNKQFLLIDTFVQNRNKLVRYEEIYQKLWLNEEPNSATLRVYISFLKRFFKIKSLRGVGYVFEGEIE